MKNLLGYFTIALFAIGASTLLFAAPGKSARVTQVVKDVRVLAANQTARPAAINDNVVEGNAVRTGGESRAELTFSDETLTRLGANSVFTFGEGAKSFDLASGAMLLAAPKQSGTVRVNVGAATAAVSGFTALFEHGKVNKMIVAEGHASVHFKGVGGGPCDLGPGNMIVWPSHPTHCPKILTIDLEKLVSSAGLIKMKKLPDWAWKPLQQEIQLQQETGAPPGGYADPTGGSSVYQKNQGAPTPPPEPTSKPRGSPPGARNNG